MSFRIGEEIAQSPTEIDPSIPIGWVHAIAFDLERKADIIKKEIG
jgi:hypothetical protein